MKLSEIIKLSRGLLDDPANDLWQDWELVDYAQSAMEEIALRCRIIRDSTTVGEVLSSGSIVLAGGSGSILSVSVNGIVVTSGAVPFNTNLLTTTNDLATNIQNYVSIPDYTAVSDNISKVTITAKAGTGANPNGYVVSVSTSGAMTATIKNMAGGTSLCKLYILPGVSNYEIDKRIINILRVKTTLKPWPIEKKSLAEMDANFSDWESTTGDPSTFIPDEDAGRIVFYPKPKLADTVTLTVYRMPLNEFSVNDLTVEPEMNSMHHRKLITGIMTRAYRKQHLGGIIDETKARAFADLFKAEIEEITRNRIQRESTIQTARPVVMEGSNQRG